MGFVALYLQGALISCALLTQQLSLAFANGHLQAATSEGLSEKLVERLPSFRKFDPVWIVELTVAGREIRPGVPFLADSNWLKDTSIVLRNRTNKTIDHAAIALRFTETGDRLTNPWVVYHINLGQPPPIDRFTSHGTPLTVDPMRKPLGFLGGGLLVVNLGDYFGAVRAAIEEKMPFEQITKCAIDLGDFFFQDGMRWSLGVYRTPDPDQPGRFVNVEGDYFPGDPLQYWPHTWPRRRQVP